jgi:hypothetical protein
MVGWQLLYLALCLSSAVYKPFQLHHNRKLTFYTKQINTVAVEIA